MVKPLKKEIRNKQNPLRQLEENGLEEGYYYNTEVFTEFIQNSKPNECIFNNFCFIFNTLKYIKVKLRTQK